MNETNRLVSVPILRTGDLSLPFSVICHTRQLTAIENKDYLARPSLEQSRIYFNPGEKVSSFFMIYFIQKKKKRKEHI